MINHDDMPKIVPSGYRILFVMRLLLNGKFSQKEINEKMSSNPYIEQVFTKDTLLKIINTLRVSEIKITKQGNKYFICDVPWKMNLAQGSIDTLEGLGAFVASLGQENLLCDYRNFLLDLAKYLPEDVFSENFGGFYEKENILRHKKHLQLVRKVEAAKNSGSRMKITTGQESYVFDSYNFEYEYSRVFLAGYSVKEHEIKKIDISEIKSIKQLPQKSSGVFFPSSVTFKIKGRLAKSYNLRENEKIIAWEGDDIVVASKGDDKKLLLRRLFRYKDLCEVMAPESFREEFVTMAQKTFALYETQ